MEKNKTSFVKGAAILAVAGILVKIIGALFRIPLFNAVGPEGMSYYEVAYPYYSWLLVISSAGLPTAVSKMVSERVTLGDYDGAKKVFRKALVLLTAIGIATSLFMFFAADALANLSTFHEANLSFRALAPALFIVSIMCAYRGYLQGMQRMMGTAISQVVEQIGKLAIGLTLAIKLLPMGPQYAAMGALIGVSASELLALGVIIIIYLRSKKNIAAQNATSKGAPSGKNIMRGLLLIAIPITIGASISPLTGIMDSALIGRILTGNLGWSAENAKTAYALLRTNVTTIVNMPGVLTMALAMSLVPAISSRMAVADYKGVRTCARLGMKLALIVGLPCAAGLFVLGRPIMGMLYSTLTEVQLDLAEELMKVASIGVIFLSLVQSMTGVVQGMGKPMVPVFNLFIGFILKVAAMLVLMNIPNINIVGAAVSTVVCYAFAGVADAIYTVRKSGMKINIWDVVLKPAIAAGAMGVTVYLAYDFASGSLGATMATLLSVAVGVLAYAVLIMVFKAFSREELRLIPGGRYVAKLMYGSEPVKKAPPRDGTEN